MHQHTYIRLCIMVALSFLAMYILMYAMVNTWNNVLPNYNQLYMAGLMAAPMGIIEILVMGKMYNNKKANVLFIAGSFVASIFFFMLIRQQTLITDTQFLKSMIPHHAGAILMCEQAPLQDESIKTLCKSIISNQQEEINQMNELLRKLP